MTVLMVILALDLGRDAHATTYTVKQDGTGNYNTIQAAVSAAQAGDTVTVSPGIYEERVTLERGGTAAAPITIQAVPARGASMHGFNTTGCDNVRIVGFKIIAPVPEGWEGGGIWLASNNIELLNNYIEIPDIAINSAWSIAVNNIKVSNNHIYGCVFGINAIGTNWLIDHNEVERLMSQSGDADYSRFFGENIIFRNNYFHGTRLNEIGDAHTDGFQTFDFNGEYCHNITIEGNIVQSCFEGVMMEQFNANPKHNDNNIIVRNNVFDGGELGGAWGICANNMRNLTVANNVFVNMRYNGVGFTAKDEGYTTGVIKNNIFYNVGRSYFADKGSTYSSGHNLVYNGGDPDPASPTDRLNINPVLIDPANLLGKDGLPFTFDDGCNLQSTSPALNAGENLGNLVPNDIRGTLRPQAGAMEIGAYEYAPGIDPPPTPTPTPTPPPAGINFLQLGVAVPATTSQNIFISFPNTQWAGNVNVVVIGWSNEAANVLSVIDNHANHYVLAVGPASASGVCQAIYSAANIHGGSTTVSVTFDQPANDPDIRVLEYGGIAAVDNAAGASGEGNLADSGSITTANATGLIVAANTVATINSGPGPGYTMRVITSGGNLVEDQIINAAGNYHATAPLDSAGTWVMQAVAFKRSITPGLNLISPHVWNQYGSGRELQAWRFADVTRRTFLNIASMPIK